MLLIPSYTGLLILHVCYFLSVYALKEFTEVIDRIVFLDIHLPLQSDYIKILYLILESFESHLMMTRELV